MHSFALSLHPFACVLLAPCREIVISFVFSTCVCIMPSCVGSEQKSTQHTLCDVYYNNNNHTCADYAFHGLCVKNRKLKNPTHRSKACIELSQHKHSTIRDCRYDNNLHVNHITPVSMNFYGLHGRKVGMLWWTRTCSWRKRTPAYVFKSYKTVSHLLTTGVGN